MTDNKEHFEEEIWFSSVSEEELAKYDKEAAFASFQQRVKESQKQPGTTFHLRRWLSYAAVVMAVAAVGYFSFKGGQSNLESAFGDIVIEAPQGSRTQMTLPDGTKVWLNAGSKIEYSQGYCFVNRLVHLVGEGYFEVARNEQLPFSVKSDGVQVRVLGTKFNFRDYPTDTEAMVSLAEGSVSMNSLKDPSKEQILKPGQRATVDKQTGEIRVEEDEVGNSSQWTKGRLIFDGEPLADIVRTLERSYNIKITISNPRLLTLRFYGDFLRQEQTLGEVLDALAATGKLHYERKGKNVTLY